MKASDRCSPCTSDTPSHLPPDASLTAASVAAFMKKVNRIRFNTVNVVNKEQENDVPIARPRSCPSLENLQGQGRGVSPRSTASLPRERSDTNGKFCTPSGPHLESKKVEFSVATTATSSSMATKTTNTIASQTSFCFTTKGGVDAVVEAQDLRHYFPYEHLFPLALPNVLPCAPPSTRCQSCGAGASRDESQQTGGVASPQTTVPRRQTAFGEQLTLCVIQIGQSPCDVL